MRVLPKSPKDAPITWLENRLDAWAEHAATIGVSPQQLAPMVAQVQSARADYQNALQQRQRAKDATRTQDQSLAEMRRQATALIATIKAHADATGDENVYALAHFDPPATPTPSADPVPPTDITFELRAQGVIDIAWKGTVAEGTTYEVQRQIVAASGATGPWATIGTVPARTLADAGVPAGSAQVGYRLRAIKPAAGAGRAGDAPRESAFTSTRTISLGVVGVVGGQPVAGAIEPRGEMGAAG